MPILQMRKMKVREVTSLAQVHMPGLIPEAVFLSIIHSLPCSSPTPFCHENVGFFLINTPLFFLIPV